MSAARLNALGVALLFLAGLSLQSIGITNPNQPRAKFRVLARYFTILTNALVGIVFALVALNRRQRESRIAGVMVAIGVVGIVYHTLLVPEVPFTGANCWADLVLHTLVPLAVPQWWLIWGGTGLRPGHLPYCLVWPVQYCPYAPIRGQAAELFPWFFLDLGTYGAPTVALNIAGLTAVFSVAGFGVLGLAR